MRILVIEEKPQLARNIARALTRNGHATSVAHDGAAGLQSAQETPPDLIVPDLNLPGLDGPSVLARLRGAKSPARVIILTARGDVEHRVRGLKAGADDYLAKPFAMEELFARVEAPGRRGATPAGGRLLEVDGLQLDMRQRRVTRGGAAVALSPREFDVLQVLMREPGRVFSRTELCERLWQPDHEYDTRAVEIFITRLRKKVDAGFQKTGSTLSAASGMPCVRRTDRRPRPPRKSRRHETRHDASPPLLPDGQLHHGPGHDGPGELQVAGPDRARRHRRARDPSVPPFQSSVPTGRKCPCLELSRARAPVLQGPV